MARNRIANDLFEDSTMTFGEHIEELRKHLWRAIIGVAVACCLTLVFADKVVLVLTNPLRGTLEEWHKKRINKLTDNYKTTQSALPTEKRAKVPIEATIDAEQWTALTQAIAPKAAKTEPPTIKLQIEAYQLVQGLNIPLAEANEPWSIKTLSAQEAFLMYFKAALGAAIIIASPWVFYQIYSFVAVGLYAHERRFVNMSLPFVIGLFLTGVVFCYFVMLPVMLRFFIGVNDWMDLQPDIRLNEWVGFCVILMIIFGGSFQLPLLMLVVERVGLVKYETMVEKRRMAIFLIVVFAALVTPTPDPFSQLILAIPLYGLYEIGLLTMKRFQKKNPFALPGEESSEVDDLFAGAR